LIKFIYEIWEDLALDAMAWASHHRFTTELIRRSSTDYRSLRPAARSGIGAEIMGAGKFGHPGWHEDPEWKGAWGPNPPFHTPVFVLTHHPRPSIEMEGGTTFHVIDGSPAEVYASGTDWRASRRTTTRSKPPPRPAESRI
jgi:hypothetical protein